MEKVFIETPAGSFAAHFSDKGLVRLDFPERQRLPRTSRTGVRQKNPRLRKWFKATEQALVRTLSGKRSSALQPVDCAGGTTFQRQVWAALQTIPRGETRTYGQIAALIGRPNAVRAVGQACGANPIPVLVPCHRVVAADGKIGGFSGGLAWKRKLLAMEGVRVGLRKAGQQQ